MSGFLLFICVAVAAASASAPLNISAVGLSASHGAAAQSAAPASQLVSTGAIIDEHNVDVRAENVLVLSGHQSEVFMGAWNPRQALFVSCSGDATARVWRIGAGPVSSRSVSEAAKQPTILKHSAPSASKQDKSKEVTAVDWNPIGTLLATGSSDGVARVWDSKGALKTKLQRHTLPIFSIKFSKTGDYILTGSADKQAIVWDTSSGQVKQAFELHTQSCLDVDWRTNTSFASCSSDMLIHVCELGKSKPVATFEGHTGEVNAVRWDESGQLLASCSDDRTAKIWKVDSTKPLFDLKGHDLQVHTVRWAPLAAGAKGSTRLATASFDRTVRVWDATNGKCLHVLDRHEEPVYALAFSPDGDFVASGSLDRCVNIWSVNDGSLIKSYRGTGSIYDVSWSASGERVAICCSDNSVAIIDFRL